MLGRMNSTSSTTAQRRWRPQRLTRYACHLSDELKKALEKIDKGMRVLASDVGEFRRRSDGHDRNFKKLFEQLAEDRKETDDALRSMALSQASMASAMSQALSQLTLAQSLERLEALAFPSSTERAGSARADRQPSEARA